MTWKERRAHDLAVSHRVDTISADDRERAQRLIDQQVEYEALAYATQQAGGDALDLERIEDAAWPVRELLRQLDEQYEYARYPKVPQMR